LLHKIEHSREEKAFGALRLSRVKCRHLHARHVEEIEDPFILVIEEGEEVENTVPRLLFPRRQNLLKKVIEIERICGQGTEFKRIGSTQSRDRAKSVPRRGGEFHGEINI
jgi:hypothetical protein